MSTNFAILDLSTLDLVIILAIILLLFGGRKLPQLSRGVAESMREFRSGLKSGQTSDDKPAAKKNSK